ncbi:ATP-binding protein [Tumebacillus permanentifrigoris]|uniref:Uncharacterized protein n=1 Tax=Tumebacillus permanentifrigoris TaxID=378543 RepID=A0A316DDS1_9BACL|nr:ATP-binding protein [Tumebacillus permanentifrigoris]PWK14940.1 hypothetical protein C7459_104142 [Tumebacillus permanentifrigoris]
MEDKYFDSSLILAAEDFPDDEFEKYHTFSEYENKILRKLIAHGPVLLRGGRGSGKSTLMKEAYFRTNRVPVSTSTLGVYLSLRYLPLLKSEGLEYEKIFCKLLIEKIKNVIQKYIETEVFFEPEPNVGNLQQALFDLSSKINKRFVLFFDDAAHIGRETPLKDFFDIFRTISSSYVSCKAAIYPGVTEFGTRFDLFNDASVIDIARNEEANSFTPFFVELLKVRYPVLITDYALRTISLEHFARFMGRAVTGNVRAFIFACNYLLDIKYSEVIALADIEATLKYLASEYYWPLLEELEPKLGGYEPLIEPTRILAEKLFHLVSETLDKPDYGPSCLVHREHVERLKKLFEIMEYAGFIVKRDASRAMKSGGRGTRYILNLCNLIEVIPNSRLTHDLVEKWASTEKEYCQIFRGGELDKIILPETSEKKDLGILEMSVEVLKKSKVYPYGLTDHKIDILKEGEIVTVSDLAEASDDKLYSLPDIGEYWVNRIRSVLGQAIWM